MYGGNPYGKEMEMANMGGHGGMDDLSHGGAGGLVNHLVPVKTCWCANKMVDPMAQVHKAANLDIMVCLIPLICGFVMLFYDGWRGWAMSFILMFGIWLMLAIAVQISVTTLCGKLAFKVISAIWLVWRTCMLIYLFIMCIITLFYLLWAIFVECGWSSQGFSFASFFFYLLLFAWFILVIVDFLTIIPTWMACLALWKQWDSLYHIVQ